MHPSPLEDIKIHISIDPNNFHAKKKKNKHSQSQHIVKNIKNILLYLK